MALTVYWRITCEPKHLTWIWIGPQKVLCYDWWFLAVYYILLYILYSCTYNALAL